MSTAPRRPTTPGRAHHGVAKLLKTKTAEEEYRQLPAEAVAIVEGLAPQASSRWVFPGRNPDQGVARVRCPNCRYEFLVAFSCKLRGLCPSCHQKRELLRADWAEQELLEDVPHRQVVLTIPKRLRIFFRYDRKLLGEFAGCAWRALKLYFGACFDSADVTLGAVGFVPAGYRSEAIPRPKTPQPGKANSYPATLPARHSLPQPQLSRREGFQ